MIDIVRISSVVMMVVSLVEGFWLSKFSRRIDWSRIFPVSIDFRSFGWSSAVSCPFDIGCDFVINPWVNMSFSDILSIAFSISLLMVLNKS